MQHETHACTIYTSLVISTHTDTNLSGWFIVHRISPLRRRCHNKFADVSFHLSLPRGPLSMCGNVCQTEEGSSVEFWTPVHLFWVSKTSSPVSLAERDCFLGSNWRIAWLTIVACVAGIDICFSWWSAPFVYVCVSHASLSPIQLLFFHSLIQTISCTQSFTCPFDPTAGSSPMPYVLKKRSLGYISCFYISPLHIFFTLMYICIQCIFLGKFSGWKTGKCVDYVPQLATERVVNVWVRCERALNGSTPMQNAARTSSVTVTQVKVTVIWLHCRCKQC